MQALIEVDESNPYNMEAIDDHFYIYHHEPFGSNKPEEWQDLVKVINILKPKLNKQSHFYSEDNIGHRASNIIAELDRSL